MPWIHWKVGDVDEDGISRLECIEHQLGRDDVDLEKSHEALAVDYQSGTCRLLTDHALVAVDIVQVQPIRIFLVIHDSPVGARFTNGNACL